MAKILYTAAERFDGSSERWSQYIAWRKLSKLREVVSLDQSLCPNLFRDLLPEDWEHNVNADYRTHLFHDVEHVVRRAAGKPVNVLALIEEPTGSDVASFSDSRFEFCGFDLLDETFDVSSLTNCLGFERALRDEDLSEQGLVTSYGLACEVRDRLRREYPDEPHANCRMFAIWRMRGQARIAAFKFYTNALKGADSIVWTPRTRRRNPCTMWSRQSDSGWGGTRD